MTALSHYNITELGGCARHGPHHDFRSCFRCSLYDLGSGWEALIVAGTRSMLVRPWTSPIEQYEEVLIDMLYTPRGGARSA